MMDQELNFVYEGRSLKWTDGEHMIDNIISVLGSDFHLLDMWVNNSMKKFCKLLKLFWKLPLVLKVLALKSTDEVQGGSSVMKLK